MTELTASGKTAEETSQALAETYKLEGDKLKHFTAALDLAKAKANNLKRVLVFSLAEGEKAPAGAVEKEGSYYATEFFYVPEKKKPHGPKGKGFGGKGGKGKGRGGRGRGPRDKDGKSGGGGAGAGRERFAKNKDRPKAKDSATPSKPAT